MNKKVYTGVHLLAYKNTLNQFGMIDAWANTIDLNPTCRIILGKNIISKIKQGDNEFSVELNIEEANTLTEELKTVVERIQYLILLAKKNKLSDSAYYNNDPDQQQSNHF